MYRVHKDNTICMLPVGLGDIEIFMDDISLNKIRRYYLIFTIISQVCKSSPVYCYIYYHQTLYFAIS